MDAIDWKARAEEGERTIEALARKVGELTQAVADQEADTTTFMTAANEYLNELEAVKSALAELKAQPARVAEGWVMVPREPTEAMLRAANKSALSFAVLSDDRRFACERATYAACLAASPEPPVQQAGDGWLSVGWQYRFLNPMGGGTVWRHTDDLWNLQRPSGAREIFVKRPLPAPPSADGVGG